MTKKKRSRKGGREHRAWHSFPAWFTTPEGSWEDFNETRHAPQITRQEGVLQCRKEKHHEWKHFFGSFGKNQHGEQIQAVFVYCTRCNRFDVVWVSEKEQKSGIR